MNASRSLGMGARASGGNISGQMKAVFQVAARARCLGQPLPALLEALSKRGQPFRIGGAGALEAGFGEFETLTSGSSGQPRHIRRTMDSWIASFAVNGQMFGIGPGRRVAVLGALEQSLALYGAVMPIFAQRSRNRKKLSASKKNWVMALVAPASSLAFSQCASAAPSAASGCGSG